MGNEGIESLRHRYSLVPDDDHHARLTLDFRDGGLSFDLCHNSTNSTPAWLWHGHGAEYRINPCPADELWEWLNSPGIAALLQRVYDGYESVWNGHNHVGKLTDDAGEALDTFSQMIGERCYPQFADHEGQYYSANDWFDADRPTVLTSETDEELRTRAQQYELEALQEGIIVDVQGIENYLLNLRFEARDKEASCSPSKYATS